MATPEPGTGQQVGPEDNGELNRSRAGSGQKNGTEPGTTDQETDREPATGEETDREHGTIGGSGTSEVTAGEPGTTDQENDREHGINQEGSASEVTAGQPGATSQETNREPGTTEMGDGQPGTANPETEREPGTANTEREPGTANTEREREPGTAVREREPGTGDGQAEREPGTREIMGVEDDVEDERTSIDRENLSSEPKIEDPANTEPSAELDTTPEQEDLKTNGADIESTAKYQEAPSEHPEVQDDTHYQREAWEEENVKPQEDTEQDMEPPDSSGDTKEDEQIREALIQQYYALVSEKEKVQQQNSQLQHKLYEYFRRKKGEETRPEMDKVASEQEQRYLKYLAMLQEMRKKFKADTILHEQQMENLRVQCQEVVSQVDKEWAAFQEQKKKIALYIANRSAGKHAASSFTQEVAQLQAKEERKEKEVIQVRLENIKLKNHIQHYESTMRSREELADGLHLIDFEQLKIENQTYSEKIEERNEELLKLRKKITNTVQVLTHLKEKLQFVQAENQEQKDRLMEIEALVAHKRDILTRTKQARDSLRMDNLNLKQKCGLLGNKTLLRDFEEKVDATEELSQKLESLKRRHAELTLSCKAAMRIIEDSKLVIES
ncbi:cilia- and flagella-associated protein 184 [Pyxicephalus adspersus]|uniref:cilia- and flagella-associated protein 184 n=1 Tax=Pyxicephalus adspersus TaxID=30357 RepID=UPI003B5AB2B5